MVWCGGVMLDGCGLVVGELLYAVVVHKCACGGVAWSCGGVAAHWCCNLCVDVVL